MAALHYAATNTTSLHPSYGRFTTGTLSPRKPNLLISCFSSSFPAKTTRRNNYLRQKILKTLLNSKLPPSNPTSPIESPPLQENKEPEIIQEIQELGKSENSEAGDESKEFEELREVEVSVPAGVSVDGNDGLLAKNPILKYGLWLVGAFFFQTVCAIWVFGSASIDNKNEVLNGNEKSSVLEVGGNGEGKSRVKLFLNGNGNGKTGVENAAIESAIYVNELEMERKIEEIRVMAREAREKERVESKKNGVDSEGSDEIDGRKHFKSGIEEEVDNRLIKLKKKLENAHDKMPVASVGYKKTDNARKDGVEKGELDGALLFKKKHKFKGLSGDPIEKPNGFIGSDDNSLNKSKETGNWEEDSELFKSGNGGNDAVGLVNGEKQPDLSDIDPKGSDAVHVADDDQKKDMTEVTESTNNTRKKVAKEKGARKQGKGKGAAKPKAIDDIALEKNNGRSAAKAAKSRKLNAEAVKPRESSALDIAVVSNEMSKGNDSLKGKGVGDAKLAVKCKSETDFWWSKLPYVLAILMRRGHDGEGGEGLFTLKSTSSAEDLISHTVAFEDHVDATNFCYLLESFFEDLEDFQADVVPLAAQELNEAVKHYNKRVIVVKRGQLRLYAGQPLADAEMALRAMIAQG